MQNEIERNFLVTNDAWRENASAILFCQGYINPETGCLVRIRIEGEQGYLTIKGPKQGISRAEFEYEIPLKDAEILLQTMAHKPLIHKTRYKVKVAEHIWEIDEFLNENAGLIIAEVELQCEDEAFKKPLWLGKEVTHDARYRNAALAKKPFSQWKIKV